MAVTAQTGVFSFGPQSAKGTVATNFYKHMASDIDLAAISDDRTGPPEVGGIVTPTLPYRAGTLATGGALINPRLQNTIGWLLHGAVGTWSSTANRDVFNNTATGVTNHQFIFDTQNQSAVRWMSFRKHIPGSSTTYEMGETFIDCKPIALSIALPNDGLITARVDVLGRTWQFTNYTGAQSWTYANTQFDSNESVPIGSTTGGFIEMPDGTPLPVVQATFTLANAPLDIRMEKIYGSPYLEDVTVIGRSVTIDMLVKWTDPDLYRRILTGTTSGTQWTSSPFVTTLDVYALSPGYITSTYPYQLRFQVPSLMAQQVGGIRLAGNNALMMRIVGTGLASSTHYLIVNLANAQTSYAWPT